MGHSESSIHFYGGEGGQENSHLPWGGGKATETMFQHLAKPEGGKEDNEF